MTESCLLYEHASCSEFVFEHVSSSKEVVEDLSSPKGDTDTRA